jgi:hypothetical protein
MPTKEKAKADAPAYAILDLPRLAYEIAASRTPRLQVSAIEEWRDIISAEVARGEWSVDAKNGEGIHMKGGDLISRLEEKLVDATHWPVPILEQTDQAAIEALWTGPFNLTARGARLAQLQEACGGNKAKALAMFVAEAAEYGITAPMSNQVGTKPGTEGKADDDIEGRNNPYNLNNRKYETEADRIAGCVLYIRAYGAKNAASSAAKYGTDLAGRPLKKRA